MATKNEPCERCKKNPRRAGLRFCRGCSRIVKAELVEAGYIDPKHQYPEELPPLPWTNTLQRPPGTAAQEFEGSEEEE